MYPFAVLKTAASCVSGAVFKLAALLFLCCREKTSNATFDPVQRDRLNKLSGGTFAKNWFITVPIRNHVVMRSFVLGRGCFIQWVRVGRKSQKKSFSDLPYAV